MRNLKNIKRDLNLIQRTKIESIIFSEKRPTNNMLNCQNAEKARNFTFCELKNSDDVILNIEKELLKNA